MFFNFIPGYNSLVNIWRSYSADECKHLSIIANGPELPFTVVSCLYIFCKIIIPHMIKQRGKPYDTRPLEIVFHGFFFGVFGIALFVGLYVFKGFTLFMSCNPIILPPVLIPLRSYFAFIGITLIHIYSLHFIFVALNGRKISDIHLLYHSLSLILGTFGANYQPDENVCLYVVLEINFLAIYSMLQILNSTSIEVKERLVNLRTKLYLYYLNFRQYQFAFLFVHAVLHLFTNCTMKKELAFIELVVVILLFYLYRNKEIKNKIELPYCDDSFYRENYLKEEIKID